jgi:hypothetical protein
MSHAVATKAAELENYFSWNIGGGVVAEGIPPNEENGAPPSTSFRLSHDSGYTHPFTLSFVAAPHETPPIDTESDAYKNEYVRWCSSREGRRVGRGVQDDHNNPEFRAYFMDHNGERADGRPARRPVREY